MSSGGGSLTALKRLMTEYRGIQLLKDRTVLLMNDIELSLNAPEGITAGPISEDDFFLWEAVIE